MRVHRGFILVVVAVALFDLTIGDAGEDDPTYVATISTKGETTGMQSGMQSDHPEEEEDDSEDESDENGMLEDFNYMNFDDEVIPSKPLPPDERSEKDVFGVGWVDADFGEMNRWYQAETKHLTKHLTKVIVKRKTKFQDVEIIDAGRHGRSLVLDGMLQSSEADEFLYHEALVHPAMIYKDHPAKTVFIGGGGEGATAREVLRYKDVEKVLMVDIDAEVIEICKEYLPQHHQGSYDDPRLEVFNVDAVQWIKDYNGTKFDVAILDFPDPVVDSPAIFLAQREFYELLSSKIADDGVVVTQAGLVSKDELPEFSASQNTLGQVFPLVKGLAVPLPIFNDMHGFNLAFKKFRELGNVTLGEIDARLHERLGEEKVALLKYYNGKNHSRMFTFPKPVLQFLKVYKNRVFHTADESLMNM